MPGQSFRTIVSLSELLNATLKPQLTEMPHLKPESDDLDKLMSEVKSLDQEQQSLRGRLQEITRLRKEAEQRSVDLRSRVAAQVRGKLGFTNENLLAFGIPPRKRSRKKPTQQETPPPVVTPAPEANTTSQGPAPAEPGKPK
jgi:regulator of replication initiation timing